MLDHGAQASVVDVNNSTSLHLAAANGDVDIAVLLLEREAKVDAQDKVSIIKRSFVFTIHSQMNKHCCLREYWGKW